VSLYVKICGVTRPEDAAACVGADALGINLWPGSKRHVHWSRARALLAAAPAGVARGAVTVNAAALDLAANAGIYPPSVLEETTGEAFDRVMAINVRGALHCIQACAPHMRAAGYGRIVLTSSITGPLVGARGMSVYAASKAAMLGMMRSLALELCDDGITINAVQPGNVRTPGFESLGPELEAEMIAAIPMRRVAEPEDVGWAVRFLASEEAGYITGQTIVLDGGQVLPEGMP